MESKLSNNNTINNQQKSKFKKQSLPNFKKYQMITNYKIDETKAFLQQELYDIIFFEIYNLKNDNKSFYILACVEILPNRSYNNAKYELEIFKYFYENNQFQKIKKINLSNHIFSIKYFYNPIDNKEYLSFLKLNDSYEIYLIENEIKFSLIKQEKDNTYENFINLIEENEEIYYTEFYEIIYNKYDKNIYLISCVVIGEDNGTESSNLEYLKKFINIRLFIDNKLYIIKTISFQINSPSDISFCIDEDKNLGKFNLFYINKDGIKYFEIKEKYESFKTVNLVLNNSDLKILKDLFNVIQHVFPNIFQGEKNIKYLYLIGASDLTIIDLCDKKIIKNIKLNIIIREVFIWNNKYLLFIQDQAIIIYDKRTNEVISKYKINIEEGYNIDKKQVKKWFSKENNFYGLFFVKNNLMLLNC